MRVADVQVRRLAGATELSADLGGYTVWYRFPADFAVSPRGDAPLAAALLPAMLRGEPLEVERRAPVSPRLLDGIDTLQDIFRTWYPFLQKVPVRAEPAEAPVLNPGVASFFSGGVDGTYTFLKHRRRITHLLFVKGI